MYPESTPARAAEGATAPEGPVQFRESTGRLWTVFERACADIPSTRGTRCLVFENSEVVRRLWDYPADWRRLAPRELEALSWRA